LFIVAGPFAIRQSQTILARSCETGGAESVTPALVPSSRRETIA